MNKGLWIARKNHLYCLIKKVSEGNGGDEEKLLVEHFRGLLEDYPGERIEEVIICYEEMVDQLKYCRRNRP